MRIIFLDVDGVLNRFSKDTGVLMTHPAPFMMNPELVDLNIVQSFSFVCNKIDDLRVVVSSTWRNHARDAKDFCEMTHLQPEILHDDWRTIRMNNHNDRHLEVSEWLIRHPEVTHWVAIDDTDYDFPTKHFVMTNSEYGLTYNDLRIALRKIGLHLQGKHVVQIKKGQG